MKNRYHFSLVVVCGLATANALAQTYVTPMMGGGQVWADMVHIDIYYDTGANQLHATVDDSFGIPMLRPLDPGCAFDPLQPYAVLSGKAYNSQYGWNVGGLYTLPPGSAIWIELTSSSPGLETYADWGRLGTYAPIFGTAGSPRLWRWGAVMVHNTYAVLDPPVNRLCAEYHIFFGDAETGSRANFMEYDDTTVHLEWAVMPIEDLLMWRFGAIGQTNGAPLCFLNAGSFVTNSQAVVNLHYTNSGPCALHYECIIPILVLPATACNGGPDANAAALGSQLGMELVSLRGPPGASLAVWEPGQDQPSFRMPTGTLAGTNRIMLSQGSTGSSADPYGCIRGRPFAVNKPGLFCLGFRVVDASTNGPAGGPVHAPSPVYHTYLQGGLTIASLTTDGMSASVVFGGEPGRMFYLERSPVVSPSANWQTVAGPLVGTNTLQKVKCPSPEAASFFRLRTQ
jgi:hypothetical protein